MPEKVDWRDICSKRFFGYQSWRRRRYKIHRPDVLAAMMADITNRSPDHTIVSGDLTNIALEQEFLASREWLTGVGTPEHVTVIPGNHDAYVELPFSSGLRNWQPWMTGDDATSVSFPFVRKRGLVAFVMLSTAVPTRWFSAAGELGAKQLEDLATALKELEQNNFFRIVVLHHPPEDYPTKPRKALRDRAEFRAVLGRHGAELVLHGHQHHSHFGFVNGPSGRIPVVGVPSASAALSSGTDKVARWNLFDVRETVSGWQLSVEGRVLTENGYSTIGSWHMDVTRPSNTHQESER